MLKVNVECGNKYGTSFKQDFTVDTSVAVGDVVSYNGELHYVKSLHITVDAGKMDVRVGISKLGVLNQSINISIDSVFRIDGDKLVIPNDIAEYEFAKATYAYLVAKARK